MGTGAEGRMDGKEFVVFGLALELLVSLADVVVADVVKARGICTSSPVPVPIPIRSLDSRQRAHSPPSASLLAPVSAPSSIIVPDPASLPADLPSPVISGPTSTPAPFPTRPEIIEPASLRRTSPMLPPRTNGVDVDSMLS
jgi:hypothetical protein